MCDWDMKNSFHQIPLDEETSNFLSVSIPWAEKDRPRFLPAASMLLQRTVTKIFKDFLEWMVVIFDNFLILGDSSSAVL